MRLDLPGHRDVDQPSPRCVDAGRRQWLLRMQCGPPGPGQKEVTCTIPPGSAYILSGVAQGRTQVCEQRKVAHNMCSCCWTHGIWNEASHHTRESITLRVFDTEWGRDVILNAVEVVEEAAEAGQAEASTADALAADGIVADVAAAVVAEKDAGVMVLEGAAVAAEAARAE